MKFGRLQHDAHLLLLLPQYMVVVIASFDFLRDHQENEPKEDARVPLYPARRGLERVPRKLAALRQPAGLFRSSPRCSARDKGRKTETPTD